MQKPAPPRSLKTALLLALCALLWLLFLARRENRGDPAESPQLEPAPVVESKGARRIRRPSGTPSARKPGASSCAPGAFLRCHEGDVWSEDSCGRLEAKIEECELQLCREAACEEPDSEPCKEPAEGRCDGDVVRLCYAGRAESIDCARRGMRCLQGAEGAECGPLLSAEERCTGPVRCEGEVLIACNAGRRERVDCALLGGACERSSPSEAPHCVQHKKLAPLQPGCGPCGCPPGAQGEHTCDARDEDGDGYVDEGLRCGAIPLVAFVIGDESGETSFSRAEVEAEIARANVLLASGEREGAEPELTLALADWMVLRAPQLLELSEQELSELAFDARVHPERDAFYVPLVFTDRLLAQGDVPRIGASTLPNGYCGGVQRGRAPPVGIVAIGKARAPTTVLHEIGHFFGLCHTHDLTNGLQTVADDPARAAAILCDEACNHEGDGVCDTPRDPGPESCRFDAACRPLCPRGEAPDALNLMSYYTPCRERFTPEQRRIVEHTLALRRAWHPCLTRACACEIGDDACPPGMGCRPSGDALNKGRCSLSGPRAPRAACETHAQCADGALCIGEGKGGASRCARPCRAAAPGCTCTETNLGVSFCREDLSG